MPSRRKFLSACANVAISAAIVPVCLTAAPRRTRRIAPADLGFATFAALVNSQFVARTAEGDRQSLRLIQAIPGGRNGPGKGESFSLLFEGDATRRLGQNTFRFAHARLGEFDMFIVPIGPDKSGCYEAIFSRLPNNREEGTPSPTAEQLS